MGNTAISSRENKVDLGLLKNELRKSSTGQLEFWDDCEWHPGNREL